MVKWSWTVSVDTMYLLKAFSECIVTKDKNKKLIKYKITYLCTVFVQVQVKVDVQISLLLKITYCPNIFGIEVCTTIA